MSVKPWGNTTQVASNPFCEVHHITVRGGLRCSVHRHRHKANLFYVFHGELEIVVMDPSTQAVTTVILTAGKSYTVEPNTWHQFRAGGDGVEALEVYFPVGCAWDDTDRSPGWRDPTPGS